MSNTLKVNMMFDQNTIKIQETESETQEHELGTTLVYYYQLPDGRMAPVEVGGLVELAVSELGARLVDVSDEQIQRMTSHLN